MGEHDLPGAARSRREGDHRREPLHDARNRGRERHSLGLPRLVRARRLPGVLLGLLSGRAALPQRRGASADRHRDLRLPSTGRKRSGRVHAGNRRRADGRRARPGHPDLLPALRAPGPACVVTGRRTAAGTRFASTAPRPPSTSSSTREIDGSPSTSSSYPTARRSSMRSKNDDQPWPARSYSSADICPCCRKNISVRSSPRSVRTTVTSS